MKGMRRMIGALASALCALAFMGSPAWAADVPVIKLGHVGHDHQIALYVAVEEGRALEKDYGVYFKELKPQEVYELYDGGKLVAQVQMIRVGGGSKMPAALEQGHIDMGLGGLGPTAKFVDKGSPIKILAPLNNDGDALVLGNHVAANDWAGFVKLARTPGKPLRIGYKAPMAVAYMIMTRALKEEGLTYGPDSFGPGGAPVNVVMVNIQGEDNSLPSIDGGVVDGVVINEPSVSLLVHKGVGKRVANLSHLPPKGKWDGHPCCIVAGRTEVIEKKRGAVVSVLKAIAAGGDMIARYPDKALRAETRWTGTDEAVARLSIPNVSYVYRPAREWIFGVDTWLEMMAEDSHFKRDLSGISTVEVRRRLLDLGPMEEALRQMDAYKAAK